ncbi:MAG TPA: response regulator [Verrucomicrobiae bacterium]|nr:response regulator [Verrucomicrobiae bacterium]
MANCEPKNSSESARALKGKTVLVVEDEEILRGMAVCILEDCGHRVLTAANSDEAKEVWEAIGPKLDLVVMDIIIPGLNGLELAKSFRAARPELKIMFMTGSIDRSPEIAALGGATDALFKPYAPKLLGVKVKEFLGS